MISLKAICTSLKRTSLLFVFAFALLLPASGASFRIAIVSDSSPYSNLLNDVLDVFSDSISSEFALSLINKRLNQDLKNKYDASLDRYLKAENFSAIKNLKLDESSETNANLEVIVPTLSDTERRYILSSDREAIDYIKLRDSYDMIISIVLAYDDYLPEIALYIDGELKREAIYYDSLKETEMDFLFSLFSSLFLSDSYKVVKIELPKTGTIYIDGIQTGLYTSRLILKKGEHAFSYIVPGYVSKIMDIIIDDTTDIIDLNLEEVAPTSLNISAIPYDATIYYNGQLLENRDIDKLEYPFTITATADGFSLYSMQSMVPMENITVALKPLWMDNENILELAKSDFYMNLFITLVTFGGFVASGTISNLLPEYDIKPVSVVLGGISLVSLVNMVDSMFEYFDNAKNGI